MNWRQSASSMSPFLLAFFLLWISLDCFSSKIRNVSLSFSGFVLLWVPWRTPSLSISGMSFVTVHLCAPEIFLVRVQKKHWLFSALLTQAVYDVAPKQKWDFTDHFHCNLYWHQSSNAEFPRFLILVMEILIVLKVQFWEPCRICRCCYRKKSRKIHTDFSKNNSFLLQLAQGF